MIVMNGICSMCADGKEKRLAKRNPPLCGYHYTSEQRKKSIEKNKDKPKKTYQLKRTPLKKTPLTYKRKPTGELPMFQEMWNETKEHKSFVSGKPIYSFDVRNHAHVLPKAQNRFPKFKLHKKNIVLLSYQEHDQWDNGLREDLMKLPEWNKMFELEAELKEEYKKLYGK